MFQNGAFFLKVKKVTVLNVFWKYFIHIYIIYIAKRTLHSFLTLKKNAAFFFFRVTIK